MNICLHTPLQLQDYIFKKNEQSVAYIYISETFPTMHF